MEYMNKFTDNLQRVIELAEEAARAYGSSYIGSEHIIFAMLNCPESTACRVLNACDVSESMYREYFARSIDKRSNINGYTPRTKHMIERALELSIDINGEDSLAGTEHMLLAVGFLGKLYNALKIVGKFIHIFHNIVTSVIRSISLIL